MPALHAAVGRLAAVCLFCAASAGFAATPLGEITDPPQPALDASLDILSSTIEQDGGRLTFRMQLRGDLPATLPLPDDIQTCIWYVDTDGDPATGQPHGPIGSEFNVRAVISQNWGGGWADVTGEVPGGGEGVVTVAGSTIAVTVWLSMLGNPASFAWNCATFAEYGGLFTPGNDDTAIGQATPLAYTPPAFIAVTTPILELCPSGPAQGQLQVELRDAAGNVLPNSEHLITYHSTNEAVATVDANGLVTAIAPPDEHWQTPYIEVWADGVMTDNSAVIRVNAIDVGVTHETWPAPHVSFYMPAVVEGVDLAALTADFQVVQATELAWNAQKFGLGTASPVSGGRMWFVLDVASDPVTSVCGASGNPIRLGWTWGQPVHNSCYIVNDPENRRPQWFVLWHEMGHDFTAGCNAFNMFLWSPSGTHNSAYGEGLASLAALWAWRSLTDAYHGLSPAAYADIDAHYSGYADSFEGALANYRAAGHDYDTIDADVVDGILLELWSRYGVRCWYDLFSTFLPATDPIPVAMDTKEKQATWFVAALSASAGEDLRPYFVEENGFPIDAAAWDEIYGVVSARIAARTWNPTAVGDTPPPPLPGDRLVSAVPNPFNPRTDLRFVLATEGPALVTIHDARGRRVRTLAAGPLPAGEHAAFWDGRDEAGRRVASGAYLARLRTASGTSERKLTLVK